MAINQNNVRMYLTFTKKQAEWLRKCAKKCNLQISDFVKWLIDKNIGRYFAKMNNLDKTIIQTLSDENKNDTEWTQEQIDKIFEDLGEPIKKEENEDDIPF